MKDIIFSTATELARAIRKKRVSAVEVLAQTARHNGALNAITKSMPVNDLKHPIKNTVSHSASS